jgi:fructan beta-fructosidase
MMRIRLSTSILAAIAISLSAADLPVAAFDGPDYARWTATGTAFGDGPADKTLPNQMPVTGFTGRGFATSYHGGDDATGTLTSPPFVLERSHLNFLIGGGDRPGEACLDLLLGDKVVRTATGRGVTRDNAEGLSAANWDVSDLIGQTVRIQILDRATGSWGHINADDIVQSDTAAGPTIPASDVDGLFVEQKLYHETYRPQFHFTSQTNWLNDPNGLVFYRGEYHLFFQHNPSGIEWGNMTWGHAVSPDLVHWTQLPDALKPDASGTMYSGSAVVDWNNTSGFGTAGNPPLVAMYTAAGKPFTQRIAYSTDRGRAWTKFDGNPVVPNIHGENRDPKVIWFAPTSTWVMALYLDHGSDYALFTSPDLKKWTKIQDLTLQGCSECPDFFPLDLDGNTSNRKWVFTGATGAYQVGSFDGKTFTPETKSLAVEHGENCYAMQTWSDVPAADGRRIQIGWMRGGRYPRMPFNQQMSFPCELTLHSTPDGPRMFKYPVKEIESLYDAHHNWQQVEISPGHPLTYNVAGTLFDISAEIDPGTATKVTFNIRGTPVTYKAADGTLTCLGTAKLKPVDGRIKLRILVDRASIETFGNGGAVAISDCFLPPPGDRSITLTAAGGTAKVVSLRVHELKSAWGN